jgi:uncharacterized membrane protein
MSAWGSALALVVMCVVGIVFCLIGRRRDDMFGPSMFTWLGNIFVLLSLTLLFIMLLAYIAEVV